MKQTPPRLTVLKFRDPQFVIFRKMVSLSGDFIFLAISVVNIHLKEPIRMSATPLHKMHFMCGFTINNITNILLLTCKKNRWNLVQEVPLHHKMRIFASTTGIFLYTLQKSLLVITFRQGRQQSLSQHNTCTVHTTQEYQGIEIQWYKSTSSLWCLW